VQQITVVYAQPGLANDNPTGMAATGKLWNCSMWYAEGKMRNEHCGMTVIGPQVRPRDRRYYAVYSTPRAAGA